MHLELTVNFSMKEKLQVHRYGYHKDLVVLTFQKLNLAATHEQGNGHITITNTYTQFLVLVMMKIVHGQV